jgi:hypothetical protein
MAPWAPPTCPLCDGSTTHFVELDFTYTAECERCGRFKAIKPAIEKAGYDPLRVDKHEHVNRIDDEIIGQIRRSRFMVADFTGQRYGVYFEAGMMLGLGRTVIWMCDKKQLDQLHFDVRQFNFIDYESLAEAQDRLYNRILAIEGEGPGQFEKPRHTGKTDPRRHYPPWAWFDTI